MATLSAKATSLEPNVKTPWDPKIYWPLAILTGFGAAGILAGLNYRRLGRPELVWPTIGISAVAFVAMVIGLAFIVVADNSNSMIAFAVNIPPAWLLQRLQGPLYEDWTEDHPDADDAGWAIPVGVGAGFAAVTIGLFFAPALLGEDHSEAVDHFNRGVELQQQGLGRQAIAEYTSAIALHPDFVEAYENRGILRAVDLGNLDAASRDLDKAVEIDPSRPSAYFFRAALHADLGNPDEAISDAEMALSLTDDEVMQTEIELLLQDLRNQAALGQ